MKTQPIDIAYPVFGWPQQELPERRARPVNRQIEVNDLGYDERAARLGRLEHREVKVMTEQNIDVARFRI